MAKKTIRQKKKRFKKFIASFVFALLGRAIKTCYKLDSRVKNEFNAYPDDLIFRMNIMPDGPSLMMKKEKEDLIILKDSSIRPDLDIIFKSIEGALMALTGKKSVATCYSEQRFIITGDLAHGTRFVRIMNLVEANLFPKIWTALLLNNQVPVREKSMLRIYIGIIFGK